MAWEKIRTSCYPNNKVTPARKIISMNKRICIVGGGFGGLYTALRLNELPLETTEKPEILLIDKRDRFLFTPLLYELITGELQSWEIAPPFQEVLADTGIRFLQGEVTGIDLENQWVKLANNSQINYDKLVIALGGTTPLDIVPGAVEYALPFRTLEDAYQLEEKLRVLEHSKADKIRIAIVGGGYSGVELACKLADRLGERGRIRLIEKGDMILASSPEFNRETAKQVLQSKNVWIDLETTVDKIDSDTISLFYKGQIDTIPVDLVLWTVGTRVVELVSKLPLKQEKGRLVVNTNLQSVDNPDVFALGDVAYCQDATGQEVPATAQVAFQQSDYCAWNIWACLTQRPLLPFRYQNQGEMLSLGLDNATITGNGVKLDGMLAQTLRRLIYLYRLPNQQHQLSVGLNWITKPLFDLLQG